ncbi:MAG: SCP2 sterol-binding domain-containing protein [Anaerolineales bacterium]
MAIKFPSDEWIKELSKKLNASESYAQVAASWEGDNIFIILPDADYADTAYLYINLQHGKAFDARQLKSLDEQKALFTTSAPFNTWRRVLEGKLDPIQGIFSGKLKLVGSMAQVQRSPKATYELAKIAGLIDSDFGT